MWLRRAYFRAGRLPNGCIPCVCLSPAWAPSLSRLTREIRARPRCRNGRTTFTRRNWRSKRNATTVSRYLSFRRRRRRRGRRGREGWSEGGHRPSRFVDAKPIYVPPSRVSRVTRQWAILCPPPLPAPTPRPRGVTRQRSLRARDNVRSLRRRNLSFVPTTSRPPRPRPPPSSPVNAALSTWCLSNAAPHRDSKSIVTAYPS